MSNTKVEYWFKQPTFVQLMIFSFLGVIGITLCLLSMTDFFTDNPFKYQYSMMWVLIIGTILSVGKLVNNYLNKTPSN